MGYGGLPGYGPPQPPPGGGLGPPPYGQPGGAPIDWTPAGAMQLAWQRLRADAGGVLLPLGIALAIEALPGIVGTRFQPHSDDPLRQFQPDALRTTMLFNLIALAVRSFFDGGVNRFCLDVARGRRYELGTIFSGVSLFPVYFALNIVQSFAVGLGLLLFVVPGVILALGFAVAEPALVDRRLGPIAALSWSWEHTKGQRVKLLVWSLLVIVAAMLGACACGVGLFVAVPVIWIARAHIYVCLGGG